MITYSYRFFGDDLLVLWKREAARDVYSTAQGPKEELLLFLEGWERAAKADGAVFVEPAGHA